jgi:two-component system response regulator RpfG
VTDLGLRAHSSGEQLSATHLLRSAVNLATELTRARDADTGMHLERVSHYAHLIARTLPPTEGLDAEFIDDLSFFAPAHDIGKVAIPDHILLKQGVLEPAEFEIMKGHVMSGVTVVEGLIRDFDPGGSGRVSMLRNIVRAHHEALDGSGYPDGLKAGQIPLEARIVAVADVFDALTSDRPYKQTWSSEEAFGFLAERKGTRFDAACVMALEGHAPEVASIRQRFREEAAG